MTRPNRWEEVLGTGYIYRPVGELWHVYYAVEKRNNKDRGWDKDVLMRTFRAPSFQIHGDMDIATRTFL